jgi:hypothetical protein
MRLVGYLYEDYRDTRSLEHKLRPVYWYKSVNTSKSCCVYIQVFDLSVHAV